jgi:hypothetical protein
MKWLAAVLVLLIVPQFYKKAIKRKDLVKMAACFAWILVALIIIALL